MNTIYLSKQDLNHIKQITKGYFFFIFRFFTLKEKISSIGYFLLANSSIIFFVYNGFAFEPYNVLLVLNSVVVFYLGTNQTWSFNDRVVQHKYKNHGSKMTLDTLNSIKTEYFLTNLDESIWADPNKLSEARDFFSSKLCQKPINLIILFSKIIGALFLLETFILTYLFANEL